MTKKLPSMLFVIPLAVFALAMLVIVLHRSTGSYPKNLLDKPRPLLTIYGNPQVPLNQPLAVAVAANGQIYVSDSGNGQVQVFDAQGKFLFAFGHQAGLEAPYGIVILPSGSVLVSDMVRGQILQFTADGKLEKVFLPSTAGIRPGNLFLTNNLVYISDLAYHQIVVTDLQGKRLRTYSNGFNFPQGIAMVNGHLVVADAGNKLLRFFDIKGEEQKVLTGAENGAKPFNILRGVAVDNLNRILVVDTGASEVRFLTEQGKSLFSIGGRGNDRGQLQFPAGISIDRQGKVYIADWGNNRVQIWGYNQ